MSHALVSYHFRCKNLSVWQRTYQAGGAEQELSHNMLLKIQTQVDKSHVCVTTGEDQWGSLLNNQLFVMLP